MTLRTLDSDAVQLPFDRSSTVWVPQGAMRARAWQLWSPSRLTTKQGTVLEGDRGDWHVRPLDDPESLRWIVDRHVFDIAYAPAALGPGTFQKVVDVRTVEMQEPFETVTDEGPVAGEARDWLLRGPLGGHWPISTAHLQVRHQVVTFETGET